MAQTGQGRRWVGRLTALYGLFMLAYCVVVAAFAILDRNRPTSGGVFDGYVHDLLFLAPVTCALLVLAAMCDPSLRLRRRGPRPVAAPQPRPRRGWAVAVIAAAVTSTALGLYAFSIAVVSLWYDLHYASGGVIGASFAIIGVWLAYVIAVPAAALGAWAWTHWPPWSPGLSQLAQPSQTGVQAGPSASSTPSP